MGGDINEATMKLEGIDLLIRDYKDFLHEKEKKQFYDTLFREQDTIEKQTSFGKYSSMFWGITGGTAGLLIGDNDMLAGPLGVLTGQLIGYSITTGYRQIKKNRKEKELSKKLVERKSKNIDFVETLGETLIEKVTTHHDYINKKELQNKLTSNQIEGLRAIMLIDNGLSEYSWFSQEFNKLSKFAKEYVLSEFDEFENDIDIDQMVKFSTGQFYSKQRFDETLEAIAEQGDLNKLNMLLGGAPTVELANMPLLDNEIGYTISKYLEDNDFIDTTTFKDVASFTDNPDKYLIRGINASESQIQIEGLAVAVQNPEYVTQASKKLANVYGDIGQVRRFVEELKDRGVMTDHWEQLYIDFGEKINNPETIEKEHERFYKTLDDLKASKGTKILLARMHADTLEQTNPLLAKDILLQQGIQSGAMKLVARSYQGPNKADLMLEMYEA